MRTRASFILSWSFPQFFQPLIILLFFNVCLPQISTINPPDLFTYKNLHSLTKWIQSLTHILAKSQLCIPYHRNLENEKIAFFTYNGIKVATKAFFGLQWHSKWPWILNHFSVFESKINLFFQNIILSIFLLIWYKRDSVFCCYRCKSKPIHD